MKTTFYILVLALAAAALCYAQEDAFAQTCLDAHNAERVPLGIAELIWNDELAEDALSWARSLARRNSLKHSSNRRRIGENIARRRSNENSVQLMLDGWVSEKKYYRHKAYPRCSTTGDKGDVGHYTQMIWEATSEVGCGLASGFGRDYLVCRYKTSGNRNGKYVYDKNRVIEVDVVENPEITNSVNETTPVVAPVETTPVVETPVVQAPVVTPVVQTPVATPVVQKAPEESDPFKAAVLKAHNDERTPLGIPSLKYSDELAENALEWAKELASRGSLKHSSGRVHIGENIAYTGTKANSVVKLLGMWMDERQYYVHRPYPNCSNTGDKSDVGHYTQVIWAATTEVGCGLASRNGKDFLVCQYKTSGNRQGKYAY